VRILGATDEKNPIVRLSIGTIFDHFCGKAFVQANWWMDHPFEEGVMETQHFIFMCDAEILELTPPRQRSYLADSTVTSWPDCYPRELIPEWIEMMLRELERLS
jgi:hypothetical protein